MAQTYCKTSSSSSLTVFI